MPNQAERRKRSRVRRIRDLTGKPVIHLHGEPSSRFEVYNPDLVAIAERLHIRLILPARPGIGLSDWQSYTIASYPDILVQFADRLGLDRFPYKHNG